MNLSKKYYQIGKKMFPINRSLTGYGTKKTLKIIKSNFSEFKIRSFKSGQNFYDWKIPQEWNISDAYVMDSNKKKIINFKKNNLHVLGYSMPVNKILNKKQLLDKIHILKKQKDAIPYITSYYKKNWGFCATERFYRKIEKTYNKNDKFTVVIKSKFKKNGKLNYGEFYIKGKTKKEILISTNICHPSMANNELSGPIVCMCLMKYFAKYNNKYSIRFIFVPETIGSIAFIKSNYDHLKKFLIGGYVLSCIGDERNYSCIFSKYKNNLSDRALQETFEKLNIKFKEYSFLKRGSDERQFNSPNIDFPIALISRSKFHEYPEYHTSLDNFKLVTEKGIRDSFNLVKKTILKLQSYIIPKASLNCEPFMSKYNLYPSLSLKNNKDVPQNIMDFIQYSDGKNDLNQISKLINVEKKKVKYIYKLLLKKKLSSK